MSTWTTFKNNHHAFDIGGAFFALDLSRAGLPENLLATLAPKLTAAHAAMAALEAGTIANPDEHRQVGHYWLRAPELAPDAQTTLTIRRTLSRLEAFTAQVHSGEIHGADGPFENLLCIGIGGSALGPQLAAAALGKPGADKLTPYFFDNTDPDGFDYVFAQLAGKLGRTLVIVTSKSGGTIETRNGMLEAKARYTAAGLAFGAHAVAITGEGSKLDKAAEADGFIARFPMWDWVGGRTSELAAVGLLPAALQGLDIRGLLEGAAAMDKLTRLPETEKNPAALLAAAWHHLTAGRGAKDMVILPYKDRLLLFARYLQQLVMESLGKRLDLAGNVVEQGISVYGNKGTTDQHAYVQQLRDGVPNFFATFIEVLRDRDGTSLAVEPATTSGDYLQGFFLGTRFALSSNHRASITLTIDHLDARALGSLIALFERTVGLYASLVGINAYDQPGVEAGKKAANIILAVGKRVAEVLQSQPGKPLTIEAIADAVDIAAIVAQHLPTTAADTGAPPKTAAELTPAEKKAADKKATDEEAAKLVLESKEELIFKLCQHLAANPDKNVIQQPGSPFTYTHA
jgi:glucose-6-phosphate isomerase